MCGFRGERSLILPAGIVADRMRFVRSGRSERAWTWSVISLQEQALRRVLLQERQRVPLQGQRPVLPRERL